MDDDDGLSDAAKDLKAIRAEMETLNRRNHSTEGSNRAVYAGLMAVILTHPRPAVLGPVLKDHMARLEAAVNAEPVPEDHLKGIREVHQLALDALEIAEGLAPPSTDYLEGRLEALTVLVGDMVARFAPDSALVMLDRIDAMRRHLPENRTFGQRERGFVSIEEALLDALQRYADGRAQRQGDRFEK